LHIYRYKINRGDIMKLEFIGLTDKGRVRDHNEDSYLANEKIYTSLDRGGDESITQVEVTNSPLIFAVADGMGGHEGGEVASNMALELLKEKIVSLPEENTIAYIHNIFKEIHTEVLKMGREMDKNGMGTTLTGCIFCGSKFYIFNVGDSRVYRFRGDYIAQVTRDHSLREETGDDTLQKNIITSCIGGGVEEIRIDVTDFSSKIAEGDLFFIMSDGIVDSLTDDDLEVCFQSKEQSIQDTLRQVLELSLEKGSSDNVTGILIKILEMSSI
jgi:PPM family protein phosphatase